MTYRGSAKRMSPKSSKPTADQSNGCFVISRLDVALKMTSENLQFVCEFNFLLGAGV